MGNQMENALKNAGIEIGMQLGENVNAALDDIENQLSLSENNENGTIEADNDGADSIENEKPNADVVKEMREKLDEQNATIDRLVSIMGTMVTKLGVQQVDTTGENVNTNAFPQLSGNEVETENIPLINEIKLGQ